MTTKTQNRAARTRREPDKLHAALEASCNLLMMLESIDPGADATSPARRHLTHAAEALRHAIAELRLAGSQRASIVGLGFVLQSDPPDSTSEEPADRQVSPRRTA